jgi:hypothetical protein
MRKVLIRCYLIFKLLEKLNMILESFGVSGRIFVFELFLSSKYGVKIGFWM